MTATTHELAWVGYHLVRYGAAYLKPTEDAYAEQVRARVEKPFRRRAKERGYEVRKVAPSAPADGPTG